MSQQATKSSPRLRVVQPVGSPQGVVKSPKRAKPEVMGVVDQVREALKPKNRLATFLGFLLGGLVPIASFVVAHGEIDHSRPMYTQLGTFLVLGGLVYSAKTVFDWGRRAFNSGAKAMGFVVLLEGVMVAASTPWLGLTALAYLVAINGIATGCNLSTK